MRRKRTAISSTEHTLDDLLGQITRLVKRQQTLLLAIDGRGGAGKSTLAEAIRIKLPSATIVHLDDFAYPTTGVDRHRLLEQVILPLKNHEPARYQRYDWNTKTLSEWHDVPPGGVVIVEGVLTLHDDLNKYYDFRIWIECPAEVGFQRGVARDISEHHLDTTNEWLHHWMPEEKAAIEEQRPQTKAPLCQP